VATYFHTTSVGGTVSRYILCKSVFLAVTVITDNPQEEEDCCIVTYWLYSVLCVDLSQTLRGSRVTEGAPLWRWPMWPSCGTFFLPFTATVLRCGFGVLCWHGVFWIWWHILRCCFLPRNIAKCAFSTRISVRLSDRLSVCQFLPERLKISTYALLHTVERRF